MKLSWLIVFLFFVLAELMAQEPKPLTIQGFAYPDFGENYDFRNFSVEYPLNPNTDLILKGMYEKTPGSEMFRAQFLVGKRLSEKMRIIGGALIERDLFPEGANQNLFNPNGDLARKEIYLGLEYEVRPNWFLDVGYRRLLNKPKFAPNGFKDPTAKGMFNFGSRWKF